MQLIVVDETRASQHQDLVESMLRLRARVFAGRLNWQVDNHHGLERDRFDNQSPTYILGVEEGVHVVGCVRLLPPMRASMLTEVFPDLLEGGRLALHGRMIESSRFCIDKDPPGARGSWQGRLSTASAVAARQSSPHASIVQLRTRMLLAGIVEWSLAREYDELITATDLRFERLLKMVGWPLRRLGTPKMINETHSIAGSLVISRQVLNALKPEGYHSLLEPTARAG